MTLGEVISKYRSTHKLSMDGFSSISGLSKAYISMLEKNRTQRGDVPVPSIDTYKKVASAIGVEVDELIRMVDGDISLSSVSTKPTMDEFTYAMHNASRDLTEEDKEMLIEMAQRLRKMHQNRGG